MGLLNVEAGSKLPDEFNVIIEIPMTADPVKYEVDKDTGTLHVDRFMTTAMHYPCNYGYVPQTLSDDGDPCDVLVMAPFPVLPGAVVKCRAVGMLQMEDEAGGDAKVLAVPVAKLLPNYAHIESVADLPEIDLQRIQHFFEHYKDLEKGKWVKVTGWVGVDAARAEIEQSFKRYRQSAA